MPSAHRSQSSPCMVHRELESMPSTGGTTPSLLAFDWPVRDAIFQRPTPQ